MNANSQSQHFVFWILSTSHTKILPEWIQFSPQNHANDAVRPAPVDSATADTLLTLSCRSLSNPILLVHSGSHTLRISDNRIRENGEKKRTAGKVVAADVIHTHTREGHWWKETSWKERSLWSISALGQSECMKEENDRVSILVRCLPPSWLWTRIVERECSRHDRRHGKREKRSERGTVWGDNWTPESIIILLHYLLCRIITSCNTGTDWEKAGERKCNWFVSFHVWLEDNDCRAHTYTGRKGSSHRNIASRPFHQPQTLLFLMMRRWRRHVKRFPLFLFHKKTRASIDLCGKRCIMSPFCDALITLHAHRENKHMPRSPLPLLVATCFSPVVICNERLPVSCLCVMSVVCCSFPSCFVSTHCSQTL
jgi:hypothetical protein